MSKPTVAIFGTNGFLGKPILQALTALEFSKNFNLPIIAITRDASKQKSSELVTYKEASIEDPSSLEKALEKIDVFINVGPPTIDLDTILKAAIKGGAKLYIPSQFGVDVDDFSKILPVLNAKKDHSANARKLGIKTVDIATSLFAVPGSLLYEVIGAVGFDPKANKVTFIGDENAKFPISKLEDIGKVVAVVASKDPSSLPDKIRVFSDETTSEEVIKKYEASKNIKIERDHKDPQAALKEAQDRLQKYGFRGEDFLFFLNVSVGLGPGYGAVFPENEREFVNPNESVFKWGKY